MMSLIEIGIIGTVGVLVSILCVGWLAASFRRHDTDVVRALGHAFMGTTAVVIWACFTYDFFSFAMDATVLALFLGIVGALYGATRAPVSCPTPTPRTRPPTGSRAS